MNYKNISNRFLLLDTNVLINYSKFTPFFQNVFDELEKENIGITISEIVKIEFFRGAQNSNEKTILRDFLETLLKNKRYLPQGKPWTQFRGQALGY